MHTTLLWPSPASAEPLQNTASHAHTHSRGSASADEAHRRVIELATRYSTDRLIDAAAALRLLRAEQCNCFHLFDAVENMRGCVMYPQAALINHSCVPNCAMTACGRFLVLEAIAPIASGEELTYCYVRSFEEGRKETLEPWGFECTCERCDGSASATELAGFDLKHKCVCGKIVTATCATAARELGRCQCHTHNTVERMVTARESAATTSSVAVAAAAAAVTAAAAAAAAVAAHAEAEAVLAAASVAVATTAATAAAAAAAAVAAAAAATAAASKLPLASSSAASSAVTAPMTTASAAAAAVLTTVVTTAPATASAVMTRVASTALALAAAAEAAAVAEAAGPTAAVVSEATAPAVAVAAVVAAAPVTVATVASSAATPASSLTCDGDLNADLTDTAASAAFFARTGICVFENTLSVGLIDRCRADFERTAARVDAALSARGIGDHGSYFGQEVHFNEVCQRGRERLDIRNGMADAHFADARLHGDTAPWMAFVRSVLGEGAHECFRGVIDNRPGSTKQEWHADFHEWEEAAEEKAAEAAEAMEAVAAEEEAAAVASKGSQELSLATMKLQGGGVGAPPSEATKASAREARRLNQEARRITCFIPLVDLDDARCGATQYYPGSHLQRVDYSSQGTKWCMPTPARGSMIAFDYRLIHRGGANTRPSGGPSRPMMHIVYARRGYDVRHEAPTDRPLFGVTAPLNEHSRTWLSVRSAADMATVVSKGPEGRLVITLANATEGERAQPYVVAERSIHATTMPLNQWLQVRLISAARRAAAPNQPLWRIDRWPLVLCPLPASFSPCSDAGMLDPLTECLLIPCEYSALLSACATRSDSSDILMRRGRTRWQRWPCSRIACRMSSTTLLWRASMTPRESQRWIPRRTRRDG